MQNKVFLLCFLVGLLMASQAVSASQENQSRGEPLATADGAEYGIDRESKDSKDSKDVTEEALDQPYSDQHTGKTFKADGKEWLVGQYNINWTETQGWISSLGGGWRLPTRAELKSLYNSGDLNSAISYDWVWAEQKDSSSAWNFSFSDGDEGSYSVVDRTGFDRAVAVR